MVLESHPLWLSLSTFPLDDPAHAVPYSTRLRREQGWSSAFTSRVLDEYRRFLFLTSTHDELMVPSEAVDQAWHLHMLDTRAYWGELCGRVAGRPIHHTPSRGGASEHARHANAYEATLRCYRETFGEAPPADIWPSARERFAGRYRRIDTRDAWVIRKRFVTHGTLVTGAIALLAGCAKTTMSAVTGFVLFAFVIAMIVGIVMAVRQAHADKKSSSDGCGGISIGSDCGDGGGCGGGCG